MKKPTATRNLTLDPQTLRRLSNDQLVSIDGGQAKASRSRPIGC